jgi:hypothetical protein
MVVGVPEHWACIPPCILRDFAILTRSNSAAPSRFSNLAGCFSRPPVAEHGFSAFFVIAKGRAGELVD